ncbi:MAG TPA: peptidoglycan DD-metalloendopeptidase family protein [Chitinophagaceae bacterium]|nr:peptidoglycan DD-metalloendopeptidase family protein [Chitinophagaceae bacterium]HNF70884.1 peptidoglycan DD-metalloendopeptidase family protein [Chitinophagaceae bacterium]
MLTLYRILFLFLLFVPLCGSAQQKLKNQSREQLESQRLSILEEIKRTTSELNELRKDKKASVAELKALQSKLSARQSLINNINREIDMIESRIQLANKDVVVLRTELDTLKKQYAELVRYTYKNKTSADLIVFLFSSTSFNDALRRLQYVKQYRSYRADQAVKIISADKQLRSKISVLNQQKQKKDFVLLAQQEQNKILEQETAEKNKVVTELKGKERDLIQDLARKKKAADELNRAIAVAINREIELARKRSQEEARQRKLQEDKTKRDADAKRLDLARKQQAEKEKQALIDKQKRDEQERKLIQEKKDREAREAALALEKKKQDEAERNARKLSESQRIEKEKQLAIARQAQSAKEKQLENEKREQEDKMKKLLAEKQRQEEYQRQLTEDRKRQEREQSRMSSGNPGNNPRYIRNLAEAERPSPVSSSNNASNTASVNNNTEEPRGNPNVKTFERDDYKYALTPEERELTTNFEANRGRLPWPVEKGYIAEHFGKNKHPLFNVVTENYGVDIKTSIGATARAIFSGEVNSIINIPGMGQTVLINHGSFYTVYSKLAKVNVSKGSRVNMKQVIGTVSTDDDGNTQIHFEIWKVGANGSPYKVNPEQWVAQ